MILSDLKIDKTWTLFLDRDGVINLHYPNDYVKNWDEFYFLENVLDAIKKLSEIFKRIIVVTNQQGVGKQLMREEDLRFIHSEMLREIRKYGGRLHATYSATDIRENDIKQMRKPNIGMARQAKKDFPEIDFAKSIMVGDSVSDLEFGRNTGMLTVFIGEEQKLRDEQKKLADCFCDSLFSFANLLTP